ncbi:MAG: tetratricopeptide repeat protein [Acidobacteriota bacterium]|nr:tetratricopeptide repeat protein [Acidobacteriota bacterium]
MAKKVSAGKTIFKIACATGGAVLASGVGLPWLGAMAGSCLPKVLEGSLDFLVSAVADDKKQEVLANLLQKPIEQFAALGINFSNDRIESFLKSHFEAKESELNFDLPRAVVKVWEDALNKMLREKREVKDTSTLGLNRNDQFEKNRKTLLNFWQQKLHKAQSDNDLLKEFFGEKPDYFLDIEQGKKNFIDALPDQEQVEIFFWSRIEDSFTSWAKNEEKFPEDWQNSIPQNVKDELKQNLFHNFSSVLKKELKENERAWKSFEFASSLQTVSMLQSLTSNIDQIKDDTSNIKKDLAELNNVLPLIMRDILNRFDELENTVKKFFTSNQNINGLLIDFRKDVSDKLSEIGKDVSETKDYAKQAAENTEELRTFLTKDSSKFSADEKPKIPDDIQAIIDEGWDLVESGKYEDAKAVFQKALELADERDHTFAVAEVKYHQAAILIEFQGNPSAAKSLLQECLQEYRNANSDSGIAATLRQFGLIEISNGDFDQAKSYTSQALEICRKIGKKAGIGDNLRQLGWIAHACGQLAQALDLYDQSLAYALELYQTENSEKQKGEAQAIAACYAHKGMVYGAMGNVAEEESALTKALEWQRKSNFKSETAKALFLLAKLKCREGQYDDGIKYLNEAGSLYKEIGDYVWLARCFDLSARLYFTSGEEDKATAFFEAALEAVEKSGDYKEQELYLNKLGQLYLKAKKIEQARGYFDQAKNLSLQENLLDGYAAAVNCLAEIAEIENKKDERNILLTDGIQALEKLLISTQREPERASVLDRIGGFYAKMENFQQALVYFQRAKKAYQSLGDIGHIANVLGGIAWVKRKLGNPNEELDTYRELKKLVDGSPYYDLIAGAANNLASFEMRHGNLNEAKRLLDEAEFYCRKYNLPYLTGVEINQDILATEFKKIKPPEMDLKELIADLFNLINSYPESRDSLFRLWFFEKAADLHSNYRTASGIKLMICQNDTNTFLKTARIFSLYSEWCLQIVSTKFPGTINEQFEYPTERGFPPIFSFAGIPKGTPKNAKRKIDFSKLTRRYVAFGGTDLYSKATGNQGWSVLGWSIGLPEQAHQLILSSSAPDLIKQKVFFLPYETHIANDELLAVLRLGNEITFIPVYFDALPSSDNIKALYSAKIDLPILSAEDVQNQRKQIRKVKQTLTQLVSDKTSRQSALNDFVFEVEELKDGCESKESIQIQVYILEFPSGLEKETHIAFVIKDSKQSIKI